MRVFAETSWALRESLGFLTRNGHTVSLVGGGGKSTLMYFLADYCARQGRRVLVSTTTRIYAPDGSLFARDEAETECLWDTGKFAVIGTPLPGTGKLAAPEDGFLRRMLERADIAFIEADGAKHRPCKVPRAGEPVLHPQSDVVLGVFGLSAVGKPLAQACFRPDAAGELLGVEPGHILTAEDAAEILSSPMGTRKGVGTRAYTVVLNQCDDGARRRTGEEIAARLARLGLPQVVMTAFDSAEREKINRMARGEMRNEP